MANPQDHVGIVIDDDDDPIPHPRAPIPQAPPLQHPPKLLPSKTLLGTNAFKNWDTTSENTDDLPLRPATLQENRVRVGKLKGNHPPSAEFPNPPGPARLAGCPIYMSVSPATQDQLILPKNPRKLLPEEASRIRMLSTRLHMSLIATQGLSYMKKRIFHAMNLAVSSGFLEHWKGFWDTVFEDWDTTVGNADDKPLKPVTLIDNRIRVGTLRIDHPPSAEYPGPPGAHRLRDCPVYMSVSPAAGLNQLLVPLWKDERGRFVNPRYVEMELPLGDALDQAILRFDRHAESRIKEYNIACITNVARRRLMHFAAVGTRVAPHVPENCREPTLLVPEPIGDRAEETADA
ncbi:uncharacterized protein FTJAE_11207 [Fusarium tjaetaba]|uniref:Uncharacterized protein n=1 Tax=Fusarium tjaetaba TaxID=1567544 RepID=A0A8H5VHT6_9HYPO|nr:uncharacterized protein FTJAE_11207 [Fusarium tjaetaba]KAF5621574.1 hypothetical protein FTJAE_11207 [Fusarium tjaetaba]